MIAEASLESAILEENNFGLEHTKIERQMPYGEQEMVHLGLLYLPFQSVYIPWQCSPFLYLDHRQQTWLSFYKKDVSYLCD